MPRAGTKKASDELYEVRRAVRSNMTETRGAVAVCHACCATAKKIDFVHRPACWVGRLGILPDGVPQG